VSEVYAFRLGAGFFKLKGNRKMGNADNIPVLFADFQAAARVFIASARRLQDMTGCTHDLAGERYIAKSIETIAHWSGNDIVNFGQGS
jgi:hypothetical protein